MMALFSAKPTPAAYRRWGSYLRYAQNVVRDLRRVDSSFSCLGNITLSLIRLLGCSDFLPCIFSIATRLYPNSICQML